ncbi:MAG TPA: glycine--tRNA ligase subunit beta [Rhodospirillales bacterium]|nr:glycine--tRNA ligase subunit beta [Rhodospirillales bacterium]
MPQNKKELLLELLSEEIPARMQARATDDLKRLVCDGLKEAGLGFQSAEAFVTPRRLALVVDGIPEKQPDIDEERRGPRADAPVHAVKGFKGSLPKGAKVEKRQTEKGEFFFAVVKQKGFPSDILIGQIVIDVVRKFPWPKSMNWGEGHGPWVRPIHNILCLFGPRASIAITLEPGRDFRTTETMGHPFLSPKWFAVKNFADYKAKLLAAQVMLDPAERASVIEAEAQKLAKKAKLKLKHDPGLLAEVAGLVEWPVVKMGSIDKAFMDLPPEVLTTVMRHHQKYFALLDKKGKLAPKFIVVANTETKDRGKVMVAGNERVLRARLADAKFFWDQDRKRTLESRVQELAGRVFHAQLGTVMDKVIRVEELASELAESCGANSSDARWAARLCKADLSTGMVAEFPILQGVMGRYHALNDGENADVATAIAEHYGPLGPNDNCPSAPVSIAVALADRIDTLVGFFGIKEFPTGSKDPYALRRSALGVIRLILENDLRINLSGIFEFAGQQYGQWDQGQFAEISGDLFNFLNDRLTVALREKGFPHDLVNALFARGGEDDLWRLVQKAKSLKEFLETDDGANLLVAYRRAHNIVRIEEKKDSERYSGKVDENLFSRDEERELWIRLNEVEQANPSKPDMAEFDQVLSVLAKLRRPVDRFFGEVTVNCDDSDLRKNRLRLLSEIASCLNRVADFSKIEGGER